MFRSLKFASLAASTLMAVSLASAAGEAPATTGTAPSSKAAPTPAAAPAAPAAAAPAAPAAQPVAAAPAAQPAAPKAAGTGTPCEDVKQTIAAKLAAKGVKAFSLDVVAKDQVGTAKVVGSCQAGAMKITYKKG